MSQQTDDNEENILGENPLYISDLLKLIFSFDTDKRLGFVARVCETWHEAAKSQYLKLSLTYNIKGNKRKYRNKLAILAEAKDLRLNLDTENGTLPSPFMWIRYNMIKLDKIRKLYIGYANNSNERIKYPLLLRYGSSLIDLYLSECPINLHFVQLLPQSLQKLGVFKCFVDQNKKLYKHHGTYIKKCLQQLPNLKYISIHCNEDLQVLTDSYLFDGNACIDFDKYKGLELVYVDSLDQPFVECGLNNLLECLSQSKFVFVCRNVHVYECYEYDLDTESLLNINGIITNLTKACEEGRSKGFDLHVEFQDNDYNDDNIERIKMNLDETDDFTINLDTIITLEFNFASNYSPEILQNYNVSVFRGCEH